MLTEESDEEEVEADLDWRDYIALTIASLETVMLPLVVFVVILIALFLIIR